MADAMKGAQVLDAKAQAKPRVVAPLELRSELEDLWDRGLPPGDRTGWPSVDKHYTVDDGQLSIVTGWPSSGKSEWIDALAVNLGRQGWRIAFFSPENQPIKLHAAKLLEKASGKPFGSGPTERLARDEIGEHLDDIRDWFRFIHAPEGGALTPKAVIQAAEPWLARQEGCKRGLVIDPWNELEHWRPSNFSETEYISQQLSMVRNWARASGVHVWIVAHPQKVPRDKQGRLPVPRPDMISGSQHWWNKADACITVHRDISDPDSPIVEIHVQKVRFKHIGRAGLVTLKYDRVTGRYFESPARPVALEKRWDLRA